MPTTGVPTDKLAELERAAYRISDAKNHHLSEWRRAWRLALDKELIDNELFDDLMDSIDYVSEALMIAKEQNKLIMRHANKIYGGDDDNGDE